MAGFSEVSDWETEARRLFGQPEAEAAVIEDRARGMARVALTRDGVLLAALFISKTPVAIARDYLATLPATAAPDVLSGRAPADRPDAGPIVCACLGVGVNTIVEAISSQHLMSVDAIGAALGAGTNCGSCRSEIAALLTRHRPRAAAE